MAAKYIFEDHSMSKRSLLLIKALAFVLLTSQSFAEGMKIKLDTNSLDNFARDSQYDWSGFYTGGTINYTAKFQGTGQLTDEGYGPLQPKGQGPKGGVYAGYNFQVNSFIIGAEADLSYGWNHDSRSMTGKYQNITVPLYLKFRQSTSYSLRGRLGYAFNNVMLFTTLGMASSMIKHKGLIIAKKTSTDSSNNSNTTDVLYNELVNHVENGYAFGVGAEYAIDSNWVARAEYIYSNFDRKSPTLYYSVRMGLQEHEIRTGLAYKF
jgi:outer membrane immunogenic protein